jgi:hypothetical protein
VQESTCGPKRKEVQREEKRRTEKNRTEQNRTSTSSIMIAAVHKFRVTETRMMILPAAVCYQCTNKQNCQQQFVSSVLSMQYLSQ